MSFLHSRSSFPAFLAAALIVLPATSASADTTVSVLTTAEGPELNIAGDSGQAHHVSVTTSNGKYVVSDGSAVVQSGVGCSLQQGTAICSVAPHHVRVDLGDGDDAFDAMALSVPVRAFGGAGADSLVGGMAADALDGQAGDDTLDGEGIDAMLFGFASPGDVMAGGDGVDTVTYATRYTPLRVDLDGSADDGEAGENDSVGADVERVLGGNGNDVLTGGAGPDALYGAGGSDTLDGMAGADTLDGGAGADALVSRDGGTADAVACGADVDTAVADPQDTLDACESVDLPVADSVTTLPAPSTVTQSATSALEALAPGGLVFDIETVVVERDARVIALPLTCAGDTDCVGSLRITAAIPRAAKQAVASRRGRRMKTVGLGSAKFKVGAGKTKLVKAKVSRRGVTQALKTTKPTPSAKGPVKRIKARVAVSMRSAGGKATRIQRPLVIEIPQKAAS